MKLKVTVSITVGRSTLDYFTKSYVKQSIKQIFIQKLRGLPPTYAIKKIEAMEVK